VSWRGRCPQTSSVHATSEMRLHSGPLRVRVLPGNNPLGYPLQRLQHRFSLLPSYGGCIRNGGGLCTYPRRGRFPLWISSTDPCHRQVLPLEASKLISALAEPGPGAPSCGLPCEAVAGATHPTGVSGGPFPAEWFDPLQGVVRKPHAPPQPRSSPTGSPAGILWPGPLFRRVWEGNLCAGRAAHAVQLFCSKAQLVSGFHWVCPPEEALK